MRTLDEAIKHAEEVVEKNERLCKVMPEHSANAFHCAEEHRQLAEWLKELKELKQTNTAEWIWKEGIMGIDYCHCSKCGDGQWEMEFPYCPNCGADMRKEK